MTMRIYTSSDASAPQLQGVIGGAFGGGVFTTGSFVECLRQILVSGYGSQTAAGWTMPFTGTSQASFKQGAGCGFYVNVLDDGTLTAGAREAAMYGFETMSAVGTGTGQFPTVAQQATGIKFRKSDTADTVARQWACYADASTFYFFSVPQTGTQYFAGFGFGNFHSYVTAPADAFNCMIMGRITSAAVDTTTNETIDLFQGGTNAISALGGHYVARQYSQSGSSATFSKSMLWGENSAGANNPNGASAAQPPYPNPADNTLLLTRALVWDTTASPVAVRGYLRGFYGMAQISTNIPLGQHFNGTGLLSGKTIRVLGLRTGGSAAGRIVIEDSDTWDS